MAVYRLKVALSIRHLDIHNNAMICLSVTTKQKLANAKFQILKAAFIESFKYKLNSKVEIADKLDQDVRFFSSLQAILMEIPAIKNCEIAMGWQKIKVNEPYIPCKISRFSRRISPKPFSIYRAQISEMTEIVMLFHISSFYHISLIR